MLRPSIILFGESLPEDAFRIALQETEKAELFIVLGSSLTVSPANQFPIIAKEHGSKLVIVNRDHNLFDSYADLVINDTNIGTLLVELDEEF